MDYEALANLELIVSEDGMRFSEIYHFHFGRTGGVMHLTYEFLPVDAYYEFYSGLDLS